MPQTTPNVPERPSLDGIDVSGILHMGHAFSFNEILAA